MTNQEIEDIDTSVEEPIIEDIEVDESDSPTIEDYNTKVAREKELLKEIQTLKAQKEHFKKKATQTKETINTTNTPTGLTREEAILFAKGLDEDDINLAAKIAKVEGISLLKATEDEHFQFKLQQKQQEIKSKGAKLGASTGGGFQVPNNLSDEEHEAQARKILAGL